MRSSKRTLLRWALTLSISRWAQAKDMFLFSGQSNMEGWTNLNNARFADYMADPLQFGDVVKALEDPLISRHRRRKALRKRIAKTEEEAVASHMASELMTLFDRGLLTNMTDPVAGAECSFVTTIPVSVGTVPVSSSSMCGHMFGHELMFSKSLKFQGYTEEIVVHKAAVGGKKIQFFLEEYWSSLNRTIHKYSGKGDLWKGFVWHQGSQDTHEGDSYLTYEDNLKSLVKRTRFELCRANAFTLQASGDTCEEDAPDLPVVIVQVGFWPLYDFEPYRSQVVRAAQASYCDSDPRAELVVTNDLSRFFHYDASSFVISGDRIAQAMVSLLQSPDGACYLYGACAEIPRSICDDPACSSSCSYNETKGECFEFLSADET